MNLKFIDILDEVLEKSLSNQPMARILDKYFEHTQDLQTLLETASVLDHIRLVELPKQHALNIDRQEFLHEVTQLEIDAVSPSLLVRINRWIASVIPVYSIKQLFTIKEKRKMSAMLANIILIMCILFASTGGTVALAYTSLPDSPLYPVKLAAEQIQISLLAEPEDLASQHLILAQKRSREILRLVRSGEIPPESTSFRLQEQYNLALHFAAQLGETEMLSLLTRARLMVQEQLQEMSQVRSQLQLKGQDSLSQAIHILEGTRARVQAGLDDPAAFRWQARFGFGEIGGNPDCPLEDCQQWGDEKQYRYQYGNEGPQPEDSQDLNLIPPGAGEAGGSSDCPSEECLREREQHRYNLQPEAPGSEESGGNPDCEFGECEPSGEAYKNGPQQDQPEPGESNGSRNCQFSDCETEGGQNQNQNEQPTDSSGEVQSGGSGGSDSSPGQGGEGGP